MFVSVASSAPVVASPAVPAQTSTPSAAQELFSGVDAVWTNLTALDPGEVAVNIGLSLLVVAVLAGAVWGLRRLLNAGLDHLAAKSDALAERTGAERKGRVKGGKLKVAKLTWLLIRLTVAVIGLVVVLSIWGVDLIGWLTAGSGAVLLRLAFILLLAVGLIEITGQIIDRVLGAAANHAQDGRRTAQMHTIRPLVRACVQTFIIVIASLTALSEIGVKIGPLLASAGVVGVALGFGAQTLVKDFLTGLFMLMEDIVAVGDSVRIGDRSGVVETMTLRTIRIRNIDGTLHILPYSEAQIIDNQSKDFSAYIFNLGVSYGADIERAFAVMRQVGEALQSDPKVGPKILLPLEIMGVDAFADNAVMLKARFRTLPGQQAVVGRAYNERIKAAFAAEDIQMPFPLVRPPPEPAVKAPVTH